jgi:hypothetical protein
LSEPAVLILAHFISPTSSIDEIVELSWGAWIRTMSNLLQRQVCYHYTTPQKKYQKLNIKDQKDKYILSNISRFSLI